MTLCFLKPLELFSFPIAINRKFINCLNHPPSFKRDISVTISSSFSVHVHLFHPRLHKKNCNCRRKKKEEKKKNLINAAIQHNIVAFVLKAWRRWNSGWDGLTMVWIETQQQQKKKIGWDYLLTFSKLIIQLTKNSNSHEK